MSGYHGVVLGFNAWLRIAWCLGNGCCRSVALYGRLVITSRLEDSSKHQLSRASDLHKVATRYRIAKYSVPLGTAKIKKAIAIRITEEKRPEEH